MSETCFNCGTALEIQRGKYDGQDYVTEWHCPKCGEQRVQGHITVGGVQLGTPMAVVQPYSYMPSVMGIVTRIIGFDEQGRQIVEVMLDATHGDSEKGQGG